MTPREVDAMSPDERKAFGAYMARWVAEQRRQMSKGRR